MKEGDSAELPLLVNRVTQIVSHEDRPRQDMAGFQARPKRGFRRTDGRNPPPVLAWRPPKDFSGATVKGLARHHPDSGTLLAGHGCGLEGRPLSTTGD